GGGAGGVGGVVGGGAAGRPRMVVDRRQRGFDLGAEAGTGGGPVLAGEDEQEGRAALLGRAELLIDQTVGPCGLQAAGAGVAAAQSSAEQQPHHRQTQEDGGRHQ